MYDLCVTITLPTRRLLAPKDAEALYSVACSDEDYAVEWIDSMSISPADHSDYVATIETIEHSLVEPECFRWRIQVPVDDGGNGR